jgi:hypothetical protein
VYGLVDEALEDALYDSHALRGCAEIELNHDPVPDATTLLKFRHWLERYELTRALFDGAHTHWHRRQQSDINQMAALLHGRGRRSSPMPAMPGLRPSRSRVYSGLFSQMHHSTG